MNQPTDALRGVICALLTPLEADGSLDKTSLRRLLDFVTEGGVQVVMPGGTTGEGPLLSLDERKELLGVVAEHLGDHVPLIAHVGCMDTAGTLALARHARDLGVGAVSAIAPYYYSFDKASLEQHFSALAEAVPSVDIYTYTFPGNAKNEIPPALMRRLCERSENIKGIKISNSDLLNLRSHVTAGAGRYLSYCGSDAIMFAALCEGAAGQVSGNANLAPKLTRALYDAYRANDYPQAAAYQRDIDNLRGATSDGLHPAFYKQILRNLGVIKSATVRQPLRQPSHEETKRLEGALEHLKALNPALVLV